MPVSTNTARFTAVLSEKIAVAKRKFLFAVFCGVVTGEKGLKCKNKPSGKKNFKKIGKKPKIRVELCLYMRFVHLQKMKFAL